MNGIIQTSSRPDATRRRRCRPSLHHTSMPSHQTRLRRRERHPPRPLPPLLLSSQWLRRPDRSTAATAACPRHATARHRRARPATAAASSTASSSTAATYTISRDTTWIRVYKYTQHRRSKSWPGACGFLAAYPQRRSPSITPQLGRCATLVSTCQHVCFSYASVRFYIRQN
jgi:hypothetical protein